MLFFKTKKEKAIDWFYKAKEKLRDDCILPLNTEAFPANVHFHVRIEDGKCWVYLEEVTDKETLEFENLFEIADVWLARNIDSCEQVRLDTTLNMDCVSTFKDMLGFVKDSYAKWQKRVAARKIAKQSKLWRDAGIAVVTSDYYCDYSIRIQPIDLDTYIGKCSEYMKGKDSKEYPFDVAKYREYVIEQFALKCRADENKLNAEFPPIELQVVDEWYQIAKREVENAKRIEERNKSCRKTLDDIKAKCTELRGGNTEQSGK